MPAICMLKYIPAITGTMSFIFSVTALLQLKRHARERQIELRERRNPKPDPPESP